MAQFKQDNVANTNTNTNADIYRIRRGNDSWVVTRKIEGEPPEFIADVPSYVEAESAVAAHKDAEEKRVQAARDTLAELESDA